jgi:hypothetical protein
MAITTSLVEAATALRDQFGVRLDTDHDDGRRIMADVLRDRFGISSRDARKLVEDLEYAWTIRYHTNSAGVGPSMNYDAYWQLEVGE